MIDRRHQMMRAILFLGALLLAATSSEGAAMTPGSEKPSAEAASTRRRTERQYGPLASRPAAPPTVVTTLDGKSVDLAALKGRVVLIDFWATWCPPCRAEIPHFQALYMKYQPRLQILGLAMDQDGAGTVTAFVKAQGMTYPVALGTEALGNAYGGIRGIPTTFLIDKQGRIAKKYFGDPGGEVFEQDVTALLQEP